MKTFDSNPLVVSFTHEEVLRLWFYLGEAVESFKKNGYEAPLPDALKMRRFFHESLEHLEHMQEQEE